MFVVINKIDLCSKTSIQQTITCLTYLLKHGHGSTHLLPFVVRREEDLVKAADMFVEKSICPIFAVSCVTGENIDLLKKFLNILPPRLSSKDQERLSLLPVDFRVRFVEFNLTGSYFAIVFIQIDEIYTNNASGAAVVGGTLKRYKKSLSYS